jgi:hypothetical protein
MKKLFLLLFTLIPIFAIAQSLNDYKYALIPSKFEFSAEPNEFNMNTFTKMYLEKYGFEAYSDDEKLPADFASSRCNKVYVDVINKKNLFTTIFVIEVKDCQNNILFTSNEGRSKEKEYRRGFPQALRAAFDSFKSLNHKYNGTIHDQNQKSDAVVTNSVVSKIEYVETKTTADQKLEQTAQTTEVVKSNNKNILVLLAKKTENGFLLLDEIKRLEFELLKTSQENVFITSYNKSNGIFILRGNQSHFEFYTNDILTIIEYNVKF